MTGDLELSGLLQNSMGRKHCYTGTHHHVRVVSFSLVKLKPSTKFAFELKQVDVYCKAVAREACSSLGLLRGRSVTNLRGFI
jgi:hypothetical protein